MQLAELEVGSVFGYGGTEWVLLDRKRDRHLCLHVLGIGAGQFDCGMEARFDRAFIGRHLNGAFVEGLLAGGAAADDFTPILLDLGYEAFVHAERVGLLGWRQWLCYAERIPAIWKWQWTCSRSRGTRGTGLMCMCGSGKNGYAYYTPHDTEPVIRPAVSLLGKSEIRNQKSEIRNQDPGFRIQESEKQNE